MSWQTSRLEDCIACLNPPGISNRLWHSSHPPGAVCGPTAASPRSGSTRVAGGILPHLKKRKKRSAHGSVTLIRSLGSCRDERGQMNEIYRYALWVWYVIKAGEGWYMIIKVFRHLRENYSALRLFLPPPQKIMLLKCSERNEGD